jgi:hypothetical protein
LQYNIEQNTFTSHPIPSQSSHLIPVSNLQLYLPSNTLSHPIPSLSILIHPIHTHPYPSISHPYPYHIYPLSVQSVSVRPFVISTSKYSIQDPIPNACLPVCRYHVHIPSHPIPSKYNPRKERGKGKASSPTTQLLPQILPSRTLVCLTSTVEALFRASR